MDGPGWWWVIFLWFGFNFGCELVLGKRGVFLLMVNSNILIHLGVGGVFKTSHIKGPFGVLPSTQYPPPPHPHPRKISQNQIHSNQTHLPWIQPTTISAPTPPNRTLCKAQISQKLMHLIKNVIIKSRVWKVDDRLEGKISLYIFDRKKLFQFLRCKG